MKILAIILSFYIAILSTIMYCPDYCITEDKTQTEHQSDCSDCCSPFMLCNTCTGFVIEECTQILLPEQTIPFETGTYIPNIYVSPFLTGIWQPPKFA